MKWLEAVKCMIALMKLLSHFSEVNRARKVKAAKEVTRRNAKVFAIKISISSKSHIQENMKFVTIVCKVKT